MPSPMLLSAVARAARVDGVDTGACSGASSSSSSSPGKAGMSRSRAGPQVLCLRGPACVVKGLEPGRGYVVTVRAHSLAGWGVACSAVEVVTRGTCPFPPPPPTHTRTYHPFPSPSGLAGVRCPVYRGREKGSGTCSCVHFVTPASGLLTSAHGRPSQDIPIGRGWAGGGGK